MRRKGIGQKAPKRSRFWIGALLGGAVGAIGAFFVNRSLERLLKDKPPSRLQLAQQNLAAHGIPMAGMPMAQFYPQQPMMMTAPPMMVAGDQGEETEEYDA